MVKDSMWVFICLWGALTLCYIDGRELSPPSADFGRGRLTQPRVLHARTKRELSSTRLEENGRSHQGDITMTLDGGGAEELVVDLRLNRALLPGNHTIKYQRHGQTVLYRPGPEDIELCQYVGEVRGRPGSSAAVTTCRGLDGVIFDGKRTLYIKPAADDDLRAPHYLFEHGDRNSVKFGSEDSSNRTDYTEPDAYSYQETARERAGRHKRNTGTLPYNSEEKRYVELALVVDHGMYMRYLSYGYTLSGIHSQLIQIVNFVNCHYTPLNIVVSLVGVEIWTETNKIEMPDSSNWTAALPNFIGYKPTLLKHIPHDYAFLMTHLNADPVGGQGYPSNICNPSYSSGISFNQQNIYRAAWVLAHEIGYGLGMADEQDKWDSCGCRSDVCVMDGRANSAAGVGRWSSCNLQAVAQMDTENKLQCLSNKPTHLFEPSLL